MLRGGSCTTAAFVASWAHPEERLTEKSRRVSVDLGGNHAPEAWDYWHIHRRYRADRRRAGGRPEAGRHIAHVHLGQSAERLDPRGGDGVDRDAVHELVQQPRALRSARA